MSIQRYILFFESQIFLETFIHKTGYSCGHIFGIHARQPFPVAHARVAGPEQERYIPGLLPKPRRPSSPSAPLVPPQGPAEPSLAARTSISYYSPTRSQYRPRFQSGTTIKKKELPKDDSPNRRRSAAHQGAQFIQQLH